MAAPFEQAMKAYGTDEFLSELNDALEQYVWEADLNHLYSTGYVDEQYLDGEVKASDVEDLDDRIEIRFNVSYTECQPTGCSAVTLENSAGMEATLIILKDDGDVIGGSFLDEYGIDGDYY